MTQEKYMHDTTVIDQNVVTSGRMFWLCNTAVLIVVREWHRFLMEPSRLIGVLLQPLLFLLVFGIGFHDNFHLQENDITYVGFFFPGVLGLVVLFSSIYATLTLVEDKRCGFFHLVLIGPAGVQGAVLGKVIATASLGFVQGILFLPLTFFLKIEVTLNGIMLSIVFLLIGSLCFALMGVLCAWLCPSSSAFHAVMSIVLIPMWLLSGAMFPVTHGILWWLSYLNPMAYLVGGLRVVLLPTFGSAFYLFLGLLFFSLINFAWLVLVLKKCPIE
jgi:ABC-2 type transport system permease protein